MQAHVAMARRVGEDTPATIKQQTVLIVESEAAQRDEMAAWLDDAGYDVELCPGPSAPDYTCIGGRGRPCPLANGADMVVLNEHLTSDALMRGTPGWQLLTYYMELGKPVVVLIDASDFVLPRDDHQVKVLNRPVDRRSLLKALAALSVTAER
jgi:hypothetical protein